jgi:MFS family permease
MVRRVRRNAVVRSLLLFVVASAFGVIDAKVKGHHGNVRNAIGNVSAPWASLPMLAGAFVLPRRLRAGGLAGPAVSVAALASYSLVRAGGLHLGGQGGAVSVAENRWFLAGLLGGVVLGVVGSWFAARIGWRLLMTMVASLLVLEPAARVLWAITKGDPARTLVPNPAVWLVEILCGCVLLIVGFCYRRGSPQEGA